MGTLAARIRGSKEKSAVAKIRRIFVFCVWRIGKTWTSR